MLPSTPVVVSKTIPCDKWNGEDWRFSVDGFKLTVFGTTCRMDLLQKILNLHWSCTQFVSSYFDFTKIYTVVFSSTRANAKVLRIAWKWRTRVGRNSTVIVDGVYLGLCIAQLTGCSDNNTVSSGQHSHQLHVFDSLPVPDATVDVPAPSTICSIPLPLTTPRYCRQLFGRQDKYAFSTSLCSAYNEWKTINFPEMLNAYVNSLKKCVVSEMLLRVLPKLTSCNYSHFSAACLKSAFVVL